MFYRLSATFKMNTSDKRLQNIVYIYIHYRSSPSFQIHTPNQMVAVKRNNLYCSRHFKCREEEFATVDADMR